MGRTDAADLIVCKEKEQAAAAKLPALSHTLNIHGRKLFISSPLLAAACYLASAASVILYRGSPLWVKNKIVVH